MKGGWKNFSKSPVEILREFMKDGPKTRSQLIVEMIKHTRPERASRKFLDSHPALRAELELQMIEEPDKELEINYMNRAFKEICTKTIGSFKLSGRLKLEDGKYTFMEVIEVPRRSHQKKVSSN